VSSDGGVTFSAGASNIGSGGGSRLRATHGVEGDVWISSNGGLWHSTDSAQSFVRLPAVTSATAFGFGHAPPGRGYPALYLAGNLGNQAGIYRSDDAGQTWIAIDDPSHKFGYINHLTGDPRVYGRVYLGTGGRGILVGDPVEPAAP
jgi:xyloglucan-specific exo-beta-1,4-glucanase